MNNYHYIYNGKQLVIRVPASILSHKQLSFNQKLLLGLDYKFSKKLGYNSKSNIEIGELLNIHPNIVSYSRRQLVKMGFLRKEGRRLYLTEKHQQIKLKEVREIVIPRQVYSHDKLTSGAKLLWGEYNSFSKGHKEYFAKRSYTAKRLNASEESITNWTKQLYENDLLLEYYHKTGYCKSQRVVVTDTF